LTVRLPVVAHQTAVALAAPIAAMALLVDLLEAIDRELRSLRAAMPHPRLSAHRAPRVNATGNAAEPVDLQISN
jgi:hypothetical protein